MSEKITIWLARDGEKGQEGWCDLWIYDEKPEYKDGEWFGIGAIGAIGELPLKSQFPEIKNGEIFEAEIVLGEKL